ncbi:high affinity copper uptake protein 1-like [Haliotis rufescens]|uniref:high affinity copper uptake protein 1-like n=1 Tax=Haliotis rufescens TaxID=6454 RepID=UPI00201EB2BC|nr:high affinity copper uptake protein 1-like [Haliotis rufescens]XP_046366489.2 high affinity copper uptake protein 1-like [Haliotis rufescens]XP_046366491.2 high affinity copper uptake protein 1-like [Haliotis rufescens]XP_046366492.2 high affinity copper uptake protein 1-like [Haliotis rufescens]XP_048256023.1 high affinity copper uptake protein 1-like [Haliotis rufescens]
MENHDMHKHHMHMHDKHNMTTPEPDHDMHAHHKDMPGHHMDPPSGYDIASDNHHDHHVQNHSIHDQQGDDHLSHVHHHDNSGGHHDNSGGHHQHGHPMTFHARNDDFILFREWQLSPGKVTFFVCLTLVVVAVLYQVIKLVRARLGRMCRNTDCKRYILSKRHLIQTLLYLAQFAIGYVLMLVVMTYNVWIMVATIVGIGLGYFFCGWAEYEEIVRLRPITVRSSHRSVSLDCSRKGDQELVPLSKDTTATDITILTSNVACACDDDGVL